MASAPASQGRNQRAVPPALKTAAGILAFAGRRLAFGCLALLAIIWLTYLGLDMAGGAALGPAAGQATVRTWTYAGRLARGDWGLTIAGSDTALPRPVPEVVRERLPRSLGLLGLSLLLAALLGTALGIMAARSRHGTLIVLLPTLAGVSVPSFFAAFLLQWLATTYTRQVGRSILPVGGFGWDRHLILPALVLAAHPLAQITRLAFVSIRSILAEDYVRTAHSKGLHPRRIMRLHVLRNAAIPILTTIGVSLRFALSSLPVVELYFGWPGAGFTLLKGIAQRDDNLTVALVLCLGVLFILVNLALELSYRLIDPRLRTEPAFVAAGERLRPREMLRSMAGAIADLWRNNPPAGWAGHRHKEKRRPSTRPAGTDRRAAGPGLTSLPYGRFRVRAALGNLPLVAGGLMVLALLLIVVFGPRWSPNNPAHTQSLILAGGQFLAPPFAPGATYPWGTDALGRCLMSLILSGARQTLLLGVLAVGARTAVGVVLGAIAGWRHGSPLDRLILSLAEILASFPTLLLAMILILALGIRRGMPPFILALCLIGWSEIMQFVRGQVISIRPRPYIEGAVAAGARSPRILARHILPHLFSALISIMALEMGSVLMLLGELGFVSIFIGGGTLIAQTSGQLVLHSDVPEWGALLSNLRYMARSYPWTALYPMAAFFFAILSFNLLGEGLRRLIEAGDLIVARLVNRYTIALAVVAIVGLQWLNANSGAMPFYRQQAGAFDGQRALAHVAALTDLTMEGRALGSPGLDDAAAYIADQFAALGLQPGGQAGTFFQERTRSFERLLDLPGLAIDDGGPAPAYRQDFAAYVNPFGTNGEASGPVRLVVLGRQLDIQGVVWRPIYPELERADYSGQVVLAMSEREGEAVQWVPKSGLLIVAKDEMRLRQRQTIGGLVRGDEFPRLWISADTANRLLQGSGYTVETIADKYAELAGEQVFDLPLSATVRAAVHSELEEAWPVRHVIGYIPGTHSFDECEDCLGRQLIVVLAQYDRPPIGPDGVVYPAANDNATGVAVMLEAIRVLQETDYQPYKSMLFVAYSGEGLEGGEYVLDPDVNRFLTARAGLSQFELEAVLQLRGLGGTTGRRLEIDSSGSLRLAELVARAARRMGVPTVQSGEALDIGVIYAERRPDQTREEAPTVRLFGEGWQSLAGLPEDTVEQVSASRMEQAGRALALTLMILGRETVY